MIIIIFLIIITIISIIGNTVLTIKCSHTCEKEITLLKEMNENLELQIQCYQEIVEAQSIMLQSEKLKNVK